MKGSLKRKLLLLLVVVIGIFSGMVWCLGTNLEKIYHSNKDGGEMLIALNEIEKLTEQEGSSPAEKQIEALKQELRGEETDSVLPSKKSNSGRKMLFWVWLTGILGLLLLSVFMYCSVLRPFEKLEWYAEEIARGNLEISLKYTRSNPFGAFTWAFDHMRREILKARACEQEAIENNKTVIATLSHDIKTPVASIRAYAEGLEANMDSTPERRRRYLSVIMRKCDEVTKLTDDLLLHSLTDLDKLQIQWETLEMESFLNQVLQELSGEKEDIVLEGEIIPIRLQADGKRLAQVLENIVGNARKYAKGTLIHLWTVKTDNGYEIHIKDGGEGILPEDMPFIFEKFYRGKNVGMQSGAGLGLYIVKYIMTQMKGEVRLINTQEGLEVILEFLKIS